MMPLLIGNQNASGCHKYVTKTSQCLKGASIAKLQQNTDAYATFEAVKRGDDRQGMVKTKVRRSLDNILSGAANSITVNTDLPVSCRKYTTSLLVALGDMIVV